jgi:multiple sugar transport system ATP-binding protein
MASVEISGVTKIYPGGTKAIVNANLTIRDREFVVLVGPSGCGKSTLLRLIAGLEEETEGRIKIGDRIVGGVSPKDRDIAMVFQNYALYPHMTVRENLAFGLKLRRIKKAEIKEKIEAVAEQLGLSKLMDKKPRALSGGQMQRVALGRAIVRNPQVFLFDEPLSNLDAKLRGEMRFHLKKLHQRLRATMVYVTHDQVEAMTLGDRIAVLSEGIIQQVAPPLELYDYPVNRFVAGFIGSPPMNFFSGRLDASDGGYLFKHAAMTLSIPKGMKERIAGYAGKRVDLGVRPEDLDFLEQAEAASYLGGRVEVVEPLGDEQIIYLSTGEQDFLAKMDSHRVVSVGEHKRFRIRAGKLHLFDPNTGWNISLPERKAGPIS